MVRESTRLPSRWLFIDWVSYPPDGTTIGGSRRATVPADTAEEGRGPNRHVRE
jgi:hypothetical protein